MVEMHIGIFNSNELEGVCWNRQQENEHSVLAM